MTMPRAFSVEEIVERTVYREQARVPAGSPNGGQFAAGLHTEAAAAHKKAMNAHVDMSASARAESRKALDATKVAEESGGAAVLPEVKSLIHEKLSDSVNPWGSTLAASHGKMAAAHEQAAKDLTRTPENAKLHAMTEKDLITVPKSSLPAFSRKTGRGEFGYQKEHLNQDGTHQKNTWEYIGNVHVADHKGYVVGDPTGVPRGSLRVLPGAYDLTAFEKAGGYHVSASQYVQRWQAK